MFDTTELMRIATVKAFQQGSQRGITKDDLAAFVGSIVNTMGESPSLDPASDVWGAVADGVTDDLAALQRVTNASGLTGIPVNGRGRSYGMVIPPGTVIGLQLTTGSKLRNLTISQQNFWSGGETRPLRANGISGFEVSDVKIKRNGGNGEGAINTYTAQFNNCTDGDIIRLEITGNGVGYGILVNLCTRVTLLYPYVHDMTWQLAVDPGSEQIVGIFVQSSTDCTIVSPKIVNLLGQIGAGAVEAYQTDAIDLADTLRCLIVFPQIDHVWEAIDVTGSGTNISLTCIGGRVIDIYGYGYKFVHGVLGSSYIDCIAERCGLAGFIVAASDKQIDDIVLLNCRSISSGATNVAGAHWAADSARGIGFLIKNNDNVDDTKGAKNVRLIGCSATDPQLTPTMRYAITVENMPSEACRPQLDRTWAASGFTISEFLVTGNFHPPTIAGCLPKKVIAGVDTASIADGAALTVGPLTVTDAAFGDPVHVTFGVSLAGLTLTAYVSAVSQITYVLFNKTGGAVDLASTTITIRVEKMATLH